MQGCRTSLIASDKSEVLIANSITIIKMVMLHLRLLDRTICSPTFVFNVHLSVVSRTCRWSLAVTANGYILAQLLINYEL